jgi:simple sugar transport system substrate-binding protein
MAAIITRRSLIAGAAGAAALPFAGGQALAQAPLGIGFIYVGPTGDYGWTHSHDVGRKAIEAEYGARVKTSFVENVAEGPDAERVLRQLATGGNKLIFATSFGFMNAAVRAARAHPSVWFEHATGYQRAANLATYNARFYEGRAVCGAIAGHLSKTGTAGYIASFPIPEVVMGIAAFTLAAQKVNPNFKTKVVWASTWYDPAKEADAAKALMDQGCDVLAQHTDSPAPLQAAEARGMLGFGQASDMRTYAPKAQLTAIVDDWAPYYIRRVKMALDGTWKSGDTWDGLKQGAVRIAPYGDAVPENVRREADSLKDQIIAGTLHPLTGPIKDQKGELRVPEGQRMTDEQLSKMDWYPAGVQS